MANDLNDPLDDLFNNAGTVVRQPTPAYVAPAPQAFQGYNEPCKKCCGTGRWGWSNRTCFGCKGTGKITFKTAPQQRQANQQANARRKANTEATNIDDFKTAFPDVWSYLESKSFGFALAMKDAVRKHGELTERQMTAIRNCMERDTVKTQAKATVVAAAPAIETSKIETAFATASASGLKRPKLRIAGFTFSPAPAGSRNQGSIYVKAAQTYLGKITSGRFLCIGGVDDETRNTVLSVAADPAEAAKLHGIKTGTCSICGAELTNGESIARGIGPICATCFGW